MKRVSVVFHYKGGRLIGKEQWCTKVNILQLPVGYLNPNISRKTSNTEPGIGTDGSSQPGKTRGLTGTGLVLACQDADCWVVGQVWNRMESFIPFKSGPLAGYPDPVLLLAQNMCNTMRIAGRRNKDPSSGAHRPSDVAVTVNINAEVNLSLI